MNSLNSFVTSVALCTALAITGSAQSASYKERINSTHKAVEATRTNAVVVQVETPSPAASGKSSALHFAPDRASAQFKKLNLHLNPAAKTSSHSNTVAQLFFGSRRSIARGIDTAYIFASSQWLARLNQWDLDPGHVSNLFPGPVVNHSWVANSPLSSQLLRRMDYSALSNNVLHVAGVRRRGSGDALMAGGYNALVVGGAVQNITTAYPELDSFYSKGRTRPHLVGPFPHASAAAPVVAAAAVRLNSLAAHKKLAFASTTRAGSAQLPVELIRSILMASASGDFNFPHKKELLTNGFGAAGTTSSGLDKRYGMGMLNVAGAERLLDSDAYDSVEPDHHSNASSYDYHAGIVSQASHCVIYRLTPSSPGLLTVSLNWLAELNFHNSVLVGKLADYDLALIEIDKNDDAHQERAISAANFDTTENVRFQVKAGHHYQLIVSRKGEGAKPWPFAIAWHVSTLRQ